MISPPIHFFLLTFALLTTLINPHSIHNFCEPTNYYSTPSSTYKTNLNLLFSSLILNTPKTGFSTAIEGEPPYHVYGLALCHGDIHHDACTSCLNTASENIVRLCPYPNGGIVWYNNCGVRYSIHNFFSQFPTVKDFFNMCQQSGASKPFEFEQLVISLMESISEIAAFNAK
ncbi:Cysteine-rich repeat secretory protein 38 [Carex littledalei]|uniref:Cysteine-rich repeat secretory protein 38 n=1 Tax=Carex littledalei TaxID=544730 RepID=A0A833QEQ4_9POAL|nr:Cysteine-rich repeat secretory protein 38 [Carex littledalei]